MRCVVITAAGGPEVLAVVDRHPPHPAAGEVLVRVRAAALNRADLLQRRGQYPAPAGAPADIPGLEFAGEIAACGTGVRGRRVGDRVFGITGGGAQAEYLAVHESLLSPVPDALDWESAGAVPEAFITAHDALVTQGGLDDARFVLIHAVASGVGLAAAQLARLRGAVVLGTSRTADKLERALDFGVAHALPLPDGPAPLVDWTERVTQGAGVDVALELVGGHYVAASLATLAPRGRLILVGLVAGRTAEVDLGRILSRRLRVQGTMLRGRSTAEKAAATAAFAADVVPALADGRLRPVVDAVYPLSDVATAHRHLESNETVGKIVLTLP